MRQTPPRSVGSHRQIPLRLKKEMPRFLPRADVSLVCTKTAVPDRASSEARNTAPPQ